MFSQTVEYALRAMVHLAYASPVACSTDQIAESTSVPRAYLSKVLQCLRRAGLVESRRGIGGGISLALRPEQISMLDIVNAVEPIKRISTCPLGVVGHGTRLCALHSKVDAAIAALEADFSSTNLAEIILPEGDSLPLCRQAALLPCLVSVPAELSCTKK